MKKLTWRLSENARLVNDDIKLIAKIKEEHWPYSLESQIQWMSRNLRPDDIHLFGMCEGESNIVAYLSLVKIKVSIDGNVNNYIGIGNVCVSKRYEHCGFGNTLIQKANDYIIMNAKKGILLCKDDLVCFYQKNGWKNINYITAVIADCEYKNRIMIFPHEAKKTFKNMEIERVF